MALGSYATTVEIRKVIPKTSDFYKTLATTDDNDIRIVVAGTVADVTIILNGCEEIDWQTKKSMIKVARPSSAESQDAANSDIPINIVLDLNRVEDTCRIKGFLEDGATYSAWKKVWMLRAMCAAGNINNEGARLKSLVIGGEVGSETGDITFNSDTMQPHLEDITWKFARQDKAPHESYTSSDGTSQVDIARIEIGLAIYFGDDRFAA